MSAFDALAAKANTTVFGFYGDPIIHYAPSHRLAVEHPVGILTQQVMFTGGMEYGQVSEPAWRLDVRRSDFNEPPQRGDVLTIEYQGQPMDFAIDGLFKSDAILETGDDGQVLMYHVREVEL